MVKRRRKAASSTSGPGVSPLARQAAASWRSMAAALSGRGAAWEIDI
jgi:hypothetical protein